MVSSCVLIQLGIGFGRFWAEVLWPEAARPGMLTNEEETLHKNVKSSSHENHLGGGPKPKTDKFV